MTLLEKSAAGSPWGHPDENESPKPVPAFVPGTEEEKAEYERALVRRENRMKSAETLRR